MPKKWEKYLELLLSAYKALHPEKTKSTIFGNKSKGSNGGSEGKDPSVMEIDAMNKGKGKQKEQQANSTETKKRRFCQICANNGNKPKFLMYNTSDCYDKPGNEHKRPAPKASTLTPSAQRQGQVQGQVNCGSQQANGGKKTFKARLLELLQEDDNDSAVVPTGTVNVNPVSIEEIVNPGSAEKETTVRVDEAQTGPSRLTGQIWKAIRRSHLNFSEGL